jgi:glycosyltransferase involved in cell wall biosynthesis
MKILHVHDIDQPATGGGAIVMHRLHVALKNAGIGSSILCNTKKLRSSESTVIPRGRLLGQFERQLKRLTSSIGLNDIHCLSTFKIKQMEAYREADILHLHCIHGGFFNYLALPGLTATKTAVFTLHDMWPYTGHCAVSYDCDRWKIGCGQCPYPRNYPSIRRDNTALEWRLKRWVYDRSRVVVVTPSSVQTERAKQSMLSRVPIYEIPNGVDTDAYQPLDRQECRHILRIPKSKKVLMFAATALNAVNKGGDLLVRAIQLLPSSLKAEVMLLMLGEGGETFQELVDVETVNLGYVNYDRLKSVAYSAADLFVLPSRGESLSLVLQESMACGTPMVAFRAGGMIDLVRPGLTGYLAKRDDPEDLSKVIVQLLENDTLRAYMGQQCRRIALEEYSLELHVNRHIELYRQLCQN